MKILDLKFKISNLKSTGFTLIEILISLTLLTIVLGAVYSSFFSVQSVLERFDNVSLKYQETRTALDIMRREIESALQKNSHANKDAEDSTAFVIKDRDIVGKNISELDLTAFSFKGSGLNTISYYVEEKDGKLNLFKKEAPSGMKSREYSVEIIEGIEGFTVETFFNNQWVKTWDTANSGNLRGIVRVSIEFDDNGKKVTLVEYARPRVGTKL
jgi:prepilin-type N-terminal cleavage/methylation domain-containing protein